MSLRKTVYVAPKPPKGGSNTQSDLFSSKNWTKICDNF